MTLLEELKSYACNVDEGISRLMNNTDNYERMLKKVAISLNPLAKQIEAAMDAGDKDAAISGAHTAKGISGNLSITPLYDAYDRLVVILKSGTASEAKEIYTATMTEQNKILSVIEKYA